MNGRYCDNCENHLSEEDFAGYGSWSYTCPECGFRYNHSSELPAGEQVAKFAAAQPARSEAGDVCQHPETFIDPVSGYRTCMACGEPLHEASR